ncbi:zinc metalloprotease HtpX [Candidatus Woesearchaeota archaeon]|jgi:heat shock protein HtpX|nr:zinc metalloprotease HtpX [Candidatus Woesearchaeota archaeon]MBT4248488.1 zinc metalloprotease HtpX [Candidatus Woesearchaeota archaeon]
MIGNQIRTVILLSALTGLLIAIGAYFANIYLALVFAVLMNFASYWFSDRIVLMMYRAKEADVGKYARLHQMVAEVARKAKLPKPRVYVVPSPAANAFATGRNPKHAVVAVTQGIMELLSERELKGVIAHELAHVKNRDILIGSIAATIAGAISVIAFMARWGAIFGGFGRRDGGNVLELLALAIVTPIIAMIIQLAISRSREFMADEDGAKFIGDGKPLASALKKLEAQAKHRPMRFGSRGSAHMMIVNPLSSGAFVKMFSTHPAVEDRVKRLEKIKY